jgi:hypothetical protein
MDLPADDADAGLASYAAVGITIPVVAMRRPVRERGFVTAIVPLSGVALAADPQLDRMLAGGWETLASQQITNPDGSSSWPLDATLEAFFHDCADDVARSAATKLRSQHVKIVCRDDRCLDADAIADLAVARFDASVTMLGGGHSPFLAQPDELVSALLS